MRHCHWLLLLSCRGCVGKPASVTAHLHRFRQVLLPCADVRCRCCICCLQCTSIFQPVQGRFWMCDNQPACCMADGGPKPCASPAMVQAFVGLALGRLMCSSRYRA